MSLTEEEFVEEASAQAQRAVADPDPEKASMALWHLGMTARTQFSGGLWQVWGAITDYWTHPGGDATEGARLARESAAELLVALGDPFQERAYFERWVDRLGIVLPT